MFEAPLNKGHKVEEEVLVVNGQFRNCLQGKRGFVKFCAMPGRVRLLYIQANPPVLSCEGLGSKRAQHAVQKFPFLIIHSPLRSFRLPWVARTYPSHQLSRISSKTYLVSCKDAGVGVLSGDNAGLLECVRNDGLGEGT